jgi:hypothetical protein
MTIIVLAKCINDISNITIGGIGHLDQHHETLVSRVGALDVVMLNGQFFNDIISSYFESTTYFIGHHN